MRIPLLPTVALCALAVTATGLSSRNDGSAFVTIKNQQFQLNGSPMKFYGTNAYWLQMLSDEDMETTLLSIAAANFTVVRTWAFNDVPQKPSSGTYFQILQNGQATINDGADGLQRLDKLLSIANKFGLKILLTLTNNWNPDHPQSASTFRRRDNNVLPRGYLSNDYGGIDLYDRTFSSNPTHDLFYTQSNIISTFKSYVKHVVLRYANDPTIFAWELGNDLRCSSTLPASSKCNPQTITSWANDLSGFIKNLDHNHLVAPGDGGFYCLGCPKLFAPKTAKPPNAPSGPTFDGSFGVDTEDLISIPSVDFGTFQLFPDQIQYLPNNRSTFAITAISHGSTWITLHSATAATLKKPEALTAFGLVAEDNFKFFIPFNGFARLPPNAPCGGVDVFAQNYALVAWTTLAINGNVEMVLEYQWLQDGLQDATVMKRGFNTSPKDGPDHYVSPYGKQNTAMLT